MDDDRNVIYIGVWRPFVGTLVNDIVKVLDQCPKIRDELAAAERKRIIYGRKDGD